MLNSNLREIQAFNLSAHHQLPDNLNWTHPYFDSYTVIGKTDDGDWLCLTPTIPDQFDLCDARNPSYDEAQFLCDRSLGDTTLALASQIETIFAELTPIRIYGYGYNYTYEYKIIGAAAATKNLAFEQALQGAGMLKITISNSGYTLQTQENRKLFEFLNLKLCHLKFYKLCFWDMGYVYKIGQTTTGDWLGINAIAEFEYNG